MVFHRALTADDELLTDVGGKHHESTPEQSGVQHGRVHGNIDGFGVPFRVLISTTPRDEHHQTVRRRLSHGAAQGGHEEYLTASRDDRGTASREFRHHPELGVEHEGVGGKFAHALARDVPHLGGAVGVFTQLSPSLRIDLVVFPRTMAGEQMVRMAVFTAKAAI